MIYKYIQKIHSIKLKNIVNNYVLLVAIFGLIFALYLVISEIINPGFCPKISFIPACYIVTIAFILIILSEFIQAITRKILFYIGFLLGIILAIWFSYNQLLGLQDCPQFFKIPMCYLSLSIFIILFFLHTIICRRNIY